MKQVRSWSKPYHIPNLIAVKKVDWSIYQHGSHIPIEFHEDFVEANDGHHIPRGHSKQIQLVINEEIYHATFRNFKRNDSTTDALSLRYDGNQPLRDLLTQVFHRSYTYIQAEREKNNSTNVIVPDDLAEYIEFYKTDKPFVYDVKLIPTLSPAQQIIDQIDTYIAGKGFYFERSDMINLYLSLKTKPFVILSGISGTGKTRLVQLFAESVGATEDNGQFTLIPVRPDWSDGSDLLGYTDIKGDFQRGRLTKVLLHALQHPDRPYFVLLDEMNLARVEYYLSDLLSVMESRRWVEGKIVTSPVLEQPLDGTTVTIPPNVYVIGTVNMDETTHPFSKKVLDRANTIEFNQVRLDHFSFLSSTDPVEPLSLRSGQLVSHYLQIQDIYDQHRELVERATAELVALNLILQELGAHVGYRVRDEVCIYLAYNAEAGLMSYEEAFDRQLLQKILPRLSGSDSRVLRVLNQLFTYFTNVELEEDQLDKPAGLMHARFPRAADKVLEMRRRFVLDGFTSFWLVQ